MKKIVLVIILFSACLVLVSCKAKPSKVSDAIEFEKLFEGAIKYDVRSDSECEEGHIKGFVCMGGLNKEDLVKNIDLVSKDNFQSIVLIGEEELILYLFEELSKLGHKNMYYFEGGYQAYVAAKGNDFIPETGCGC